MYLSENSFYIFLVIGIILSVILSFIPDIMFSHYINKQEKYIKENYKIISIRDINMKVAFKYKGRNVKPVTILYCADDEDNKSKVITIESNEIYKNYIRGNTIVMQEIIYLTDKGVYIRDIKFASPCEYQNFNECDEKSKNDFTKIEDKNINLLKKINYSTIHSLFMITIFAIMVIIPIWIFY